jgi:hypothetical protein
MFDPSDPSGYFNDYRQFGTLYTKDQTASQQRLDDLRAALAYAQTLPDTDPDKNYFIQEATQAIGGQESLFNLSQNEGAIKGVSDWQVANEYKATRGQKIYDAGIDYTQIRDNLTNLISNNIFNQDPFRNNPTLLDQYLRGNLTNAEYKTWVELGRPHSFGEITQAKEGATKLSEMKGLQAQTAPLSASMLEKFNLTDPNWAAGERKLDDYYKNQAIPFATEQAKNDIYQSAYNISKGINQRMISSGLGASGLRKKALSGVKGQALGEFGKAVGAAENEAAGNIKSYRDQAAAQERAQRDLERRLQTGTAEDLFSGANQNLIGAYNTNTQAQQEKARQDAEKQLAQQQASDRMLNDIFGTAFGAAGDILSGGLI